MQGAMFRSAGVLPHVAASLSLPPYSVAGCGPAVLALRVLTICCCATSEGCPSMVCVFFVIRERIETKSVLHGLFRPCL